MGSLTNTLGEREYEGLRLYPLVVDGFRSLRRKPINSMVKLANRYKNIFIKTALCPLRASLEAMAFVRELINLNLINWVVCCRTQRRRDFV